MFRLALLLFIPLLTQDAVRGTWEGRFRSDDVYLSVRYDRGSGHSSYGRTFRRSELSDVVRSNGDVSFKLVRPAGTSAFRGKEDQDDMGGTWTFTPNTSYVQQMDKLGYGDLMSDQLFVFAMCDLSVEDARYMESSTTDRLSSSLLVKFCNHGVTPEYVRTLAAAGYKDLDSDEILRARDHGVNREYIAEMGALGFKLSLEDLVHTRDHGVTPDFVREFASFGDLTASSYVRLRDHGVNGDFARSVRELGYRDVRPEELIRLRDHGVNTGYIRRVNQEYGQRVELSEVIRLRNRGY